MHMDTTSSPFEQRILLVPQLRTNSIALSILYVKRTSFTFTFSHPCIYQQYYFSLSNAKVFETARWIPNPGRPGLVIRVRVWWLISLWFSPLLCQSQHPGSTLAVQTNMRHSRSFHHPADKCLVLSFSQQSLVL